MKTLLVDDHSLVLEGLRNFLTANGFEVVGLASNGAEALLKFEMYKPDLVLMDVQMADCDGIQATQMIKREYPDAKIVMLTAVEDDESLFAAIQAGAEGYLLKDMEPERFLRQLASAASGELPFAPGLAERLLREFNRRAQKREDKADGAQRELTERQENLLQLLAGGLTYKEIAGQMGVAVPTVRYHIKELLAKMHLTNRAQLIAYALRRLEKE